MCHKNTVEGTINFICVGRMLRDFTEAVLKDG